MSAAQVSSGTTTDAQNPFRHWSLYIKKDYFSVSEKEGGILLELGKLFMENLDVVLVEVCACGYIV